MLIVDLDDTLVASTKLNNDAYNYALEKLGFAEIKTSGRITRKSLAHLSPEMLTKVISEKQNYFTRDWMPYRLTINSKLIHKMIWAGKENCFIWTKSEKGRAMAIIEKLRIDKIISGVIFDDKKDFLGKSLKLLQAHTRADTAVIYENTKLRNLKVVDSIDSKPFRVKGYLAVLK
ncbi:MAG: hypothetical protein FWD49_02630 [Firmicutes bacterium]|nr:hypothetical protein [Bacillota bacterium]